ncbi:hypothetical protein F5884DRAFT_525239 [Xylogone sp. PMI_703]|nr:hypothetical protein F5884DRAFT_525239 [Xylogone sp. PMI_703]
MRFNTASSLTVLSWLAMSRLAVSQEVHGEGDEGTIMGPVAFLWPENRPWDASDDNIAPCGSSASITNRTIFPLSQGSVALSIADDAYEVAFYIAYSNNPTTQSAFQQQIVSNVTEVDPGHQCYKIGAIPDSVSAGTNATIQLEYSAKYATENNGKNESFYACADITFVEASDFTLQVPCFNVTASDFVGGVATTTATQIVAATSQPTSNPASDSNTQASSSSSGSGLSGGAKAGIAVGTILGSFAIVGVAAFVLLRKRKSSTPDQETMAQAKQMPETASMASANTDARR